MCVAKGYFVNFEWILKLKNFRLLFDDKVAPLWCLNFEGARK